MGKRAEAHIAEQISHATEIVDALTQAYNMELETVLNYIANSIHLDGVRAEQIKEELAKDIPVEISHAQRLAKRIKILDGMIPGSKALTFDQDLLQPLEDSADVVSIIRGVIEAEDSACRQYQKIIELCEGNDYVTQDLCIELLGDEEEHRREFKGYLKEYERR